MCGAVYLKFGGGEKGRESGNNGGRSETREVSFKMSFTPAESEIEVRGEAGVPRRSHSDAQVSKLKLLWQRELASPL